MKIKTSELEGAALDWAVATVVGISEMLTPSWIENDEGELVCWLSVQGVSDYAPSRCWASGGPLIEENSVDLTYEGEFWSATVCKLDDPCDYLGSGHSDKPLVAAMRAIVAASIGSEADIPGELLPA